MSMRAQNCLKFTHLSLFALLICISFSALAQVSRAPANYVMDDDIIVVPMVVERSFYEEFNEKHKARFKQSRQQLENWIIQEQYAKDHGLEDAGFIDLPTAEQKERFFRRNYVRFIQKDVQRANNETLKSWRDSWRSSQDELDSIRNNEQRSEYIVKSKRSRGEAVATATSTLKVGKKKFKLTFQPRVEMGMMRVKFTSDFIYIRAWLGVNGKQEIYVDRTFKSTGTTLEANYFIDEKRVLAAAHQRLSDHWNLRLTHEKISDSNDALSSNTLAENNVISVNFGMGF